MNFDPLKQIMTSLIDFLYFHLRIICFRFMMKLHFKQLTIDPKSHCSFKRDEIYPLWMICMKYLSRINNFFFKFHKVSAKTKNWVVSDVKSGKIHTSFTPDVINQVHVKNMSVKVSSKTSISRKNIFSIHPPQMSFVFSTQLPRMNFQMDFFWCGVNPVQTSLKDIYS
jgi:hypothetical protein